MQGDNHSYSPGNIALVMYQQPDFTRFCTQDRWRTLGRTVKDVSREDSAQIFARPSFGKGYTLVDAYDISQTQGKPIPSTPPLENDSKAMEQALTTLLNYAVVPIVADRSCPVPARYDSQKLELIINPEHDDQTLFASIATEVAHSRIHAKGANSAYDRADCDLDAQSVSYLICRRFGVQRDLPDMKNLSFLYDGWNAPDRRMALDNIQNMSKQIGGTIERNIIPQTKGRIQTHQAVR